MCKTSPRSALKVLAILTPICCNEPWNFPKYFLDGHLHFLRTIIRKNRKIHWKSSPQTVPNPSISNDNLITTKERKEKSSFPRLHNIWMTLKSSRKRKEKSEYFPWMQKKQREKWIEKKKKKIKKWKVPVVSVVAVFSFHGQTVVFSRQKQNFFKSLKISTAHKTKLLSIILSSLPYCLNEKFVTFLSKFTVALQF